MLATSFLRLIFVFLITSLFSFSSEKQSSQGLAEDVLKYTNQFRKTKGLKTLEMRDDLNTIARKHSENMASGRCRLGHDGYNLRVSKIKKTVNPCDGYIGENVAYGASNGKQAFETWKNSKVHRKNMLGDYKYVGIGTARSRKGILYYTQIFVR